MKQALLCVSFGTSVPAARSGIDAVERALRAAAPQRAFVRAFTSPTIRRVLAGRGEIVPSLEQALEALAAEGCGDVAVQPTHLLPGFEYNRLCAAVEQARPRFETLRLGKPLLADEGDIARLVQILDDAYPACPGEAMVWMGHGTGHAANAVYEKLQAAFQALDRTDVFVGTVEGSPALEDVRRWLARNGFAAAHLAPLLLVAGDHACNDMAGEEPESWKSVLEADGRRVRCTLQGLGLLPQVQKMYTEHLHSVLY